MLTFSIGDTSFSIPTSWNEVSVGQFLQWQSNEKIKAGDLSELLFILTGLQPESFEQLSEFDISRIALALEWIEDMPDFKELPLPSHYSLDGVSVNIPEQLTTESWGQKEYTEPILIDCLEKTGDVIDVMDKILAAYFYPLYASKNNPLHKSHYLKDFVQHDEKILNHKQFNGKSMIDLVHESKLIEAYPIASFFLRSCLRLSKQKEKHL